MTLGHLALLAEAFKPLPMPNAIKTTLGVWEWMKKEFGDPVVFPGRAPRLKEAPKTCWAYSIWIPGYLEPGPFS
jgi:hypothetical protein